VLGGHLAHRAPFVLGPFTITPASALPAITDAVVIDGTTEPGYAGTPLIEINGSSLPASTDGLLILAGGSTVRGLAINRCPRDAIRLESLGTNVIQGNFLGTDPSGTVARGNGAGGVMIYGSPGNLIGLLLAALVFALPAYLNVGARFLIPSAPFLALAMGVGLAEVPAALPVLARRAWIGLGVALSATAFYAHYNWILARTAGLLGRPDQSKQFDRLAGEIRDAFNQKLNVYSDAANHAEWAFWGNNPDLGLVKDFALSVDERRDPSVTGVDGLRAVAGMKAMMDSSDH